MVSFTDIPIDVVNYHIVPYLSPFDINNLRATRKVYYRRMPNVLQKWRERYTKLGVCLQAIKYGHKDVFEFTLAKMRKKKCKFGECKIYIEQIIAQAARYEKMSFIADHSKFKSYKFFDMCALIGAAKSGKSQNINAYIDKVGHLQLLPKYRLFIKEVVTNAAKHNIDLARYFHTECYFFVIDRAFIDGNRELFEYTKDKLGNLYDREMIAMEQYVFGDKVDPDLLEKYYYELSSLAAARGDLDFVLTVLQNIRYKYDLIQECLEESITKGYVTFTSKLLGVLPDFVLFDRNIRAAMTSRHKDIRRLVKQFIKQTGQQIPV